MRAKTCKGNGMYLVIVTTALSFSKEPDEAGQQLWQIRSEVITKANCNTNAVAEVITQADCNTVPIADTVQSGARCTESQQLICSVAALVVVFLLNR